jgi:hypothetical protein
MRYSVVLPRIESTDAEDARRALGQAQDLWTQGEQRAALDHVRQAAESASAFGQKERALALSRAVATLARAIGSASVRPPVISDAPAMSASRVKVSQQGVASAATEPPPTRAPHSLMRPTVPAKPGVIAALIATEPAMAAVALPVPPVSVPTPAPSLTPAVPIASRSLTPAVPPLGAWALTPAVPLVAAASPTPAVPVVVPADTNVLEPTEDAELVVTIAPAGWGLASPNALVGHRAERVAVAPGRGPGGTLMVRPLAPGEVAPKGSVVAVMVTLDSGTLPLPRTG